MCGRYTYYSSEEIIKFYDFLPKQVVQEALALEVRDNFNVAPGMEMPVIVRGEQAHEIEMLIWGLIPSWSKPGLNLKLINARKEGLFEKPMWKRLVKSQRCIVPARGFYEWKKMGDEKQPMYITPKKGTVLSFAGLWDEWKNDKGQKVKTYTIITTTPNAEMSDIHNRMPVILNREQAEIWLSPIELGQDMVDDLLKPAPDGSLNTTPVSKEVNNTRNNNENLIYPLP